MSTRTPRVALPWAVALAALLASGCGGSNHDAGAQATGELAAAEQASPANVVATDGGGHHQADPAPVRGSVREPVEILRDKHGISHIYAKNPRDLFFAQGYSAARDRLWQLDQWRRRGEGRMAEQFGPRFVEADRAARLFLYRGDLDTEFAAYHSHGKDILTAFAEGINAYVDAAKADPAKLPIEFRLTGTEPGYWSPSSSLIRIYGLTRNLSTEVALARRIGAVGLETTDALTVQQPPGTPLQVPSGLDVEAITASVLATYNLSRNGLAFTADDFSSSPLELTERAKLAASLSANNGTAPMAAEDREVLQFQSNNWTVAGTKTSTGRPILANDPHRAITMPSLRYLVHLNAPGWNVIGAGEPALPGVSIGHNDRIAFGLTIFAFGDEEDLYVYETNPANPDQYRYRGEWETMTRVTESIPVRGGASELVELKYTRHGPVIHRDPGAGKAYAVRAAYLEFPGTAAYLPSLRLNQARNWTEFTDGMARHFTPSENMVYADIEGNIGWFGGSITPIRPNADWSGLLPVPGDGRYEWTGYLPGNLLPRVYNPRDGFFATANEYNVPGDYEYRHLTNRVGWADAYRSDRIHEVLRAGSRFSLEDMRRLQNDYLSIPGRSLVPLLADLGTADAAVAEGLSLLRDWNHVASVDSAGATVFELWMAQLISRVSARLVPESARELFGSVAKPVVVARLLEPDATTFGGDAVGGRNAILLDALKAAMADLKTRQGEDRSQWAWGQLHHIRFEHALSTLITPDLADRLGTERFPVGGTGDTVGVAHYRTSDFRVTSGASFRQVIDVADWDRSVTINVPGQSSDPDSPFYDNLLETWSKGDYVPMAFSRSAVEAIKADSVTLKPPQ